MNLTVELVSEAVRTKYPEKKWEEILHQVVETLGVIPLAVWEIAMKNHHIKNWTKTSLRNNEFYAKVKQCFQTNSIIAPPIDDFDLVEVHAVESPINQDAMIGKPKNDNIKEVVVREQTIQDDLIAAYERAMGII